jgi:hypothetical protein
MKSKQIIESTKVVNRRTKKAAKYLPESVHDDADLDEVPHILQQVRKAIDVDGNYKIKFNDGFKHRIELPQLIAFVKKYMKAKPSDKEKMQGQAGQSLDGFMAVINSDVKSDPNKSIYVKEYNELNPTVAVLVTVPAHLFKDVQEALGNGGLTLKGSGNRYRVGSVPEFIRK